MVVKVAQDHSKGYAPKRIARRDHTQPEAGPQTQYSDSHGIIKLSFELRYCPAIAFSIEYGIVIFWIDDKQMYRGFVKAAPEKSEFDKAYNKDFSTVVLFTSEDKLVEKFKNNVHYDTSKSQNVSLYNEKKVMNGGIAKPEKRMPQEFQGVYNEQERPQTMAHSKLMY